MSAYLYAVLAAVFAAAALTAYQWRILPTPERKNAQWALIAALLVLAFAATLRAVMLW